MSSPFVEAGTVRTVEQPVSGGQDTTAIDKFRQGVNVKTERHRSDGVLLRASTTRNFNHQIEINLVGQDGIFSNDMTPFSDGEKYDPVQYINSRENAAADLPVGDGPIGFDGVIEPFTIRDIVDRNTVEAPFLSKTVRGELMDGNEGVLRKSDRVLSFVPLVFAPVVVPFVDSGEIFGDEPGAIRIPGFIDDRERTVNAYDDGDQSTLYSGAPGNDRLTNNDAINAALRLMTGSYDQDMRPYNHKSATAGFVYNNTPAGTDSIAFGGLKRS